jgi:hypothetical protein
LSTDIVDHESGGFLYTGKGTQVASEVLTPVAQLNSVMAATKTKPISGRAPGYTRGPCPVDCGVKQAAEANTNAYSLNFRSIISRSAIGPAVAKFGLHPSLPQNKSLAHLRLQRPLKYRHQQMSEASS